MPSNVRKLLVPPSLLLLVAAVACVSEPSDSPAAQTTGESSGSESNSNGTSTTTGQPSTSAGAPPSEASTGVASTGGEDSTGSPTEESSSADTTASTGESGEAFEECEGAELDEMFSPFAAFFSSSTDNTVYFQPSSGSDALRRFQVDSSDGCTMVLDGTFGSKGVLTHGPHSASPRFVGTDGGVFIVTSLTSPAEQLAPVFRACSLEGGVPYPEVAQMNVGLNWDGGGHVLMSAQDDHLRYDLNSDESRCWLSSPRPLGFDPGNLDDVSSTTDAQGRLHVWTNTIGDEVVRIISDGGVEQGSYCEDCDIERLFRCGEDVCAWRYRWDGGSIDRFDADGQEVGQVSLIPFADEGLTVQGAAALQDGRLLIFATGFDVHEPRFFVEQ